MAQVATAMKEKNRDKDVNIKNIVVATIIEMSLVALLREGSFIYA